MKNSIPVNSAIGRICGALFIILIFPRFAFSQATAMIKFGNSYVNLSKKTVGGPVQPGDTLQIRIDFYVNKNYLGTGNTTNPGKMYKARYYDSIPTNTSILPGSNLMLISNEGVICRSYTQASDGDAGTYNAAPGYPGGYQVRINLGAGAG